MATRLTYTTGTSAEVDEAFESALAAARASEAAPLPHLIGGATVESGEPIEREDPSRTDAVASRAREGAGVVADALARARAAAPGLAAAALRGAVRAAPRRRPADRRAPDRDRGRDEHGDRARCARSRSPRSRRPST